MPVPTRVARAVLFLALLSVLSDCKGPAGNGTPGEREGAPFPEALVGDGTAGFAQVTEPRRFVFPDDHGPHPGYRLEWWYYTGNLEAEGMRHFGFQLTLFRIGLRPEPVRRSSRWGANQVYMGHFAVTDVSAGRFHHFERFSRAALDLSGAQARPYRVWLEDWSAAGIPGSAIPTRLLATAGGVGIDLVLGSAKPVVLQGDAGFSRKSGDPGNASYYYSLTRMTARGTVRIGEREFPAEGLAWLDREWSTSALGKDQAGWDWFALQLSDGRELMFYRLRGKDGSADSYSGGSLVGPDGVPRPVSPNEVRIEVLDTWRSPHSGCRYPSRWRLGVPGEGLELEITPYLSDQELRTSVTYWEGAVNVKGTLAGKPIRGTGYVELTGYGPGGG